MTNTEKKQRVTIKDVAEAAGVSRSTAAYIMSGSSRYSFQAETVARVREAARQLRYVPDPIATSLRTKKNNIIIGVFGNVFFEMELAVSQALKDAFFRRGYYFIAQLMTNMADKEKIEFFRRINRWGAGLVILDIGISPRSRYRKEMLDLLSLSPPSVSLINEIEGSQVDYLKIEWFKQLPVVFRYFQSLNRKRVVYCCSETTPDIRRRFEEVSRDFGMAFQTWTTTGQHTTEDRLRSLYQLGEMAAERILAHPEERPDAICCFSDEVAMAIQRRLAMAGLRVPEDITLVSGGDRSYVTGPNRFFPIFSYRPEELAEISAEYLIGRIEAGQQTSGSHHCIKEIDEYFMLPEKSSGIVEATSLRIE